MAEWQHKERRYVDSSAYENVDDKYLDPAETRLEFDEWLDMQCRGGWELFTIREYKGTDFCLFRRLV